MRTLERLTPTDLERFERSLERRLADPTFTSRFYARFLLTNDEVAAKFAGTNMTRQASVLKRSLYLVLRAALGLEDGLEHLDDIARSHGHRRLGIPAEMYELWLDTLVTVALETAQPSESPEEIERLWRGALRPCIDRIVAPPG